MSKHRSEETILNITEDLVRMQTTHDGMWAFDNRAEILKAFDYVEEYFSDGKFVIKRYGENSEQFEGETFESSFYEHPKPSMIVSFEDNKEPEYMLHGHLDVIGASEGNYPAKQREIPENTEEHYTSHFEPLTEEEEGETRMYGRGTADMKAGVASLMKVMKDLEKDGERPSAALLLTSDEEQGGFRGAGYIFQDIGYNPEIMISAEPNTDENSDLGITYRQKGVFQLRIRAEGTSAHSSRHWNGENAANKLLDHVEEYRQIQDLFKDPEEGENWVTTMNLGKLEAGEKRTQVPESGLIEFDIRYTNDYHPEDIIQDIAEKFGVEASHLEQPAEVAKVMSQEVDDLDFEIINNEPMLFNNKEDKKLQELANAIEEATGKQPEFRRDEGASDARFQTVKGNNGVTFGPRGGNLHGPNEYIEIESLIPFYNSIRELLTEK